MYNALKYYMRLMKSYNSNKDMVVSPALKKCRFGGPMATGTETGGAGTGTGTGTGWSEKERRTNFSFALANMIQMTQAKESQLMLQTTSVVKRLKVEKEILNQASNLVADQLIQMDVITPNSRDDIKARAMTNDYDADILPGSDDVESDVAEEKDEWDINNME